MRKRRKRSKTREGSKKEDEAVGYITVPIKE